MVTQQLLDFVRAQRAAGVDDDHLRNILNAQGWAATDVASALSGQAGVMPTPTPSAPIEGIPEGIGGWNWGAAFLTWIWGIRFRVWISLLTFVPVVGYIWWIVLGIKGNQWAWEAGDWGSVEEFKKAQRPWAVWGIVFLCLAVLMIVSGFMLGLFSSLTTNRGF